MAYKEIESILELRHDTSVNWGNSTYQPLKGEPVVYDPDTTHNYSRLKIGDGSHKVTELPFVNDVITNDEIDTICGATIETAEEVDL